MDTWLPDDETGRADLAKLGWTVAFATATALAAGLWNPLNLDFDAVFPRVVLGLHVWASILLTMVAVVASLQLSLRPGIVRTVLAGVVALATALVGGLGVILALLYSTGLDDSDEKVLARDGWSELVLVQSWFFDPSYHVELRRGWGPFRQVTVVWQGAPEAPGPDAARFLGPDGVAVSVPDHGGSRVCDYVVPHGLLTLEPDRVLPGPRGTEGC